MRTSAARSDLIEANASAATGETILPKQDMFLNKHVLEIMALSDDLNGIQPLKLLNRNDCGVDRYALEWLRRLI